MRVTFYDADPSEAEYFEAFDQCIGLNYWFGLIFSLEIIVHYCIALQGSLFENPEAIESIFIHFSATKYTNISLFTLTSGACSNIRDATTEKELLRSCEREYVVYEMLVFRNFGLIFGAIIGGIIADLYGRRITGICASISWLVMSTILIFMPDLTSLKICYMFTIFCGSAISTASLVNFGELTTKNFRMLTLYAIHGHSTAPLLLRIIMLKITVWKYLLIFSTTLCSLSIFICWYIPESPRWLMTKDKKHEAYELMLEVAGLEYYPLEDTSNDKKTNIWKTLYVMFKFLFTKKLKYFLLMCLLIAVTVTQLSCAYAKTLKDVIDGRSSGFLTITIQILSYLFIVPLYIFVGKRYGILVIYLLNSGIALSALIIVSDFKEIYYNIFAVLLSLSILLLLFLYIFDIFPTFLRATIFGIVFGIWGIAYISGNTVKDFSDVKYYIICLFLNICGLLVLLFPSATREEMPNYPLQM